MSTSKVLRTRTATTLTFLLSELEHLTMGKGETVMALIEGLLIVVAGILLLPLIIIAVPKCLLEKWSHGEYRRSKK